MFEGGKNKKTRSAKLIRYAELATTISIVIYCLLVISGLAQSSAIPISRVGMSLLTVWWLLMIALGILAPKTSKLDWALRLGAYHLLFGSCLLFIAGFISPIMPLWLILATASYLLFGKNGVILNMSSLGILLFIDCLIKINVAPRSVLGDIITVVVLIVTTTILFKIINLRENYKQDLKQAKAQEILQRDKVTTIINNLADAVISTDRNGSINVYNAASLNLLDTNASLMGHNIDEIIPLTDEDGNKVSLLNALKTAQMVTKRDDLLYSFNSDDKIRLEIIYSPIRSSYSSSSKTNNDGYILIMRDITKQKSLEEERDEFISVVSHELRTPITVAEGTISNVVMMMDHPDVTQKMKLDSLNTAHDQVIFLANMVNDLSTLSRAERGVADNVEEIDVRELANKLHNKYTEEAVTRKLHLNLDLSARLGNVKASRLYLEELLQNLITNALKYTKKGSVNIIIKNHSGNIEFAVKDTGIGISKSDQQKVFNKFYRSEDYRTRETGGTGLGLYISAKLSRKLGTKIELTSRLNHGSTFSFTLPEAK